MGAKLAEARSHTSNEPVSPPPPIQPLEHLPLVEVLLPLEERVRLEPIAQRLGSGSDDEQTGPLQLGTRSGGRQEPLAVVRALIPIGGPEAELEQGL